MYRPNTPTIGTPRLRSLQALFLWGALLLISQIFPAVAQLSAPLPAALISDLTKGVTALRSSETPYCLLSTGRSNPTSGLQVSGEELPSGLRTLELQTLEYNQLPQDELWGEWISTSSGAAVWRGSLRLEEVGWNTLYFDNYDLRSGDILLISNEEGEIRGAFTDANNNASSHTLTTAPLYGELLAIYYYPSSGEKCPLPWQLSGVTTAILSPNVGVELPAPIGGQKKAGEPWFTIQSLTCADATVKYPEVESIARSELLMVVRGKSFSSATLINNSRQDGSALVLTAAHCLNGSYKHSQDLAYVRESAERTIFFFNYFSPTGDPLINGLEEQTLSGAELVAYNEDHDMCLLRITGVVPGIPEGQCAIPRSYRPYFAGWNAQRDFSAPVIGIHHPLASVRRYNMADRKPSLEDYPMPGLPVNWTKSHLYIDVWNKGTTAPGSSGSGLFDKDLRLIGALTGGNSYCSSPVKDYYYALSEVFTGYAPEQCLQPHLAPTGDVKSLDGLEPFASLPPLRLSHQLYSLMRDSVAIRSSESEIKGVSVRYDLDTSTQYLGTVIVTGAMKSWTPVTLSIYSDDRGKPGERLYTQQLHTPSYTLRNSTGKETKERTLSNAFQAFFPIDSETPLMLSAGVYHIALEAIPGDQSLPTPILLSKAQLHTTPYAWHRIGQSWQPATISGNSYMGHYWIDPIVASNTKQGNGNDLIPSESPNVILAGDRLYLQLPKSWLSGSRAALLELYNHAGLKILTHSLATYVSSLSLADDPLTSGVYILRLTSGDQQYSCKIYCP